MENFVWSLPDRALADTGSPATKQHSRKLDTAVASTATGLVRDGDVAAKLLSAYFWLYARQNSGGAQNIAFAPRLSGPPNYGGSQAGAILSYRFAGDAKRGLTAFARVSTALENRQSQELAAGLSMRPLESLPISLHAEQRIGFNGARNRGRAIYIAGGTGPDRLVESIELETYGQAGYLFAKQDSHFFDGSAVAEREFARAGKTRLKLGGGIWAGGQRGTARLDAGPRASVIVPVGDLNARVSLDWRFRLAGNAAPDSGAALSITTGF